MGYMQEVERWLDMLFGDLAEEKIGLTTSKEPAVMKKPLILVTGATR